MAADTRSPGGHTKVKVVPDVSTYNAAMSACEKCEQWQQALGLLAEMRSVSLLPNLITYSAAISACVLSQRRALALWAEM